MNEGKLKTKNVVLRIFQDKVACKRKRGEAVNIRVTVGIK